jgi:hypothetical protein
MQRCMTATCIFIYLYVTFLRMSSLVVCMSPVWALSTIAPAYISFLGKFTGRISPAQGRSCGICGGQSGTVAGFLRALRFPLPILIPPTASHSSSVILGWYNRSISGRRTKWTQSHPTPRKPKTTSPVW